MAKPTRLTQEMIDEYIACGYWDRVSIADLLKENARRFSSQEAIVDSSGERITWAELDERTGRVAGSLLRSGIRRDQALVAQIPNSANAVILLLACHKAGILSCFTPMTFRQNELRHVMQTLNAVAFVTPGKYRDTDYFSIVREICPSLPQLCHFIAVGDEVPPGSISFRSLVEGSGEREDLDRHLRGYAFQPFEVSYAVQSSGTTGMPKCIEQTGASSKVAGWGVIQRAKLTSEDIFGIIAPLSGGPGLQNFWGALQLGAKICLLEHFSPEASLELIQKERVTYLAAIPTQIIRIVKECDLTKYNFSSLRVLRTGAAAFDVSMAREAEEKLRCKVLIAGGSQETYSFAQTGLDDPPEKRLLTLGKPFPGNEVKIIGDDGRELPPGEVGQLMVRGAATSSGYFANPETTCAVWGCLGKEGWYRTGDLAKLDEQGYLILMGRKKEMIIRGGQNIYPKEIEDLLCSHPKIKEALVIGIPDEVLGERACACVTLVEGQKLQLDEMLSFLRKKHLAVHKMPERLDVWEQFPTLVDGQKIDKKTVIRKTIENTKR